MECSDEEEKHRVKHEVKLEDCPSKLEEEVDSDATEKMDSDVEEVVPVERDGTKRGPYYRRRESRAPEVKIEHSGKGVKREPEFRQFETETRRKIKLPLGSHNFPTNNKIIELLKQMQQIYHDTGNNKSFSYLRTIASLRNYGREIRDAS